MNVDFHLPETPPQTVEPKLCQEAAVDRHLGTELVRKDLGYMAVYCILTTYEKETEGRLNITRIHAGAYIKPSVHLI